MGLDEYIECETCEGKGHLEIIGDCYKSASMCCGGCSSYVECDECNGRGEVENPEYYEL